MSGGNPTWIAASTGTITGVTAGTGLSGGGVSGAVTVNIDRPVPTGGTNGQFLSLVSGNPTWVNAPSGGGGGGGTITGVTAGTGLSGGGTSGVVTVNIERPVPTGGSNGQVLGLSGGNPTWIAASTGTITGVTAGTGLSGGGVTGTVTLNIERPVPSGGSNGQILGLSGGNPTWVAAPTGGGATNLSLTRQASSIGIVSSTVTKHTQHLSLIHI